MILDVVVVTLVQLDITLELVEQITRHFAEDIGEHVEPAAMRHANDHFVGAGDAGPLHQAV